LVIDPKGPPATAATGGCLGQYLSLGSLTRFIAGARKGKSGQSLQNVRRRLTENWLDRAAEVLSIALVGIENLFDPEAVILGGSAPIEILNGLFGRLGDLRPSIRLGRPGERIRVSFSAGAERSGRCSRFSDFCRRKSKSILLSGKGAADSRSVLLLNNYALIPGSEPETVNVINMNTGKKKPNKRSSSLWKRLTKEPNFSKLIRDAIAVLIRRGEIKIPGKKRRP